MSFCSTTADTPLPFVTLRVPVKFELDAGVTLYNALFVSIDKIVPLTVEVSSLFKKSPSSFFILSPFSKVILDCKVVNVLPWTKLPPVTFFSIRLLNL